MYTKVYRSNVDPPSTTKKMLLEHETYRNSLTEPASTEFQSLGSRSHRSSYVHISSLMRDKNKYSNPASFQIDLDRDYRQVIGLRLIQGTISNTTSVADIPYILLDIKDLNFIQVQGLADVSAIVQLEQHVSTNFLRFNSSTLKNVNGKLKETKSKLSKLEVSLKDANGQLLSMDPSEDWSMLLEIIEDEPTRFDSYPIYQVPSV